MTREAFAELGQEIAANRDEILAARDDLRQVRGRLLARPRRQQRRHRRRLLLGLGAAAAATAALTLVLVIAEAPEPPRGPALTFTVLGQGGRQTGEVGRWLVATADAGDAARLAMRFSDGSRVDLEPNTRARVDRLDRQGARLRVRRGTARVHVIPRRTTRWRLDVGPFLVDVVGTRFSTSWDPTRERFGLELRRGRVVVKGPLLQQARTLVAGQRLEVSLSERKVRLLGGPGPRLAQATTPAVRPGAPRITPRPTTPTSSPATTVPPTTVPPTINPPTTTGATPSEVLAAGAGTSATQATRSRPEMPWDLALAGRYGEAIAAADRLGWPALLERSSAPHLLALGDAARLHGRRARAAIVYRRIRARFAGSRAAAEAAFSQGQLAADAKRKFKQACAWFERYLEERPRGRLARAALGRLLETRWRAGQRGAARRAARRYLKAHPAGPHASFARKLIATAPRSTPSSPRRAR